MCDKSYDPLVSVIILNWNSLKYIHKCIESLSRQSYKNIEVIFVDNDSSDRSLLECKEKYNNFKYIENKENVGFAAGMNTGLSSASGEFCLLLNTDVYLDENYIAECIKLLLENPEVSCTAGYEYKWIFPELSENKVGSGVFGITLHLRVVPSYKIRKYVFGVSGSFPIFRTSTIKKIKELRGFFFDELFETGWEDTELRFLFSFLDEKTMLCKSTKAWHVGSASDNCNAGMFQKNLSYQKRIFRNRLYVINKYIKGYFPIWYIYIKIINKLIDLYIFYFHNNSFQSLQDAKKEYEYNNEAIKDQSELLKNKINTKVKTLSYIVGFTSTWLRFPEIQPLWNIQKYVKSKLINP